MPICIKHHRKSMVFFYLKNPFNYSTKSVWVADLITDLIMDLITGDLITDLITGMLNRFTKQGFNEYAGNNNARNDCQIYWQSKRRRMRGFLTRQISSHLCGLHLYQPCPASL